MGNRDVDYRMSDAEMDRPRGTNAPYDRSDLTPGANRYEKIMILFNFWMLKNSVNFMIYLFIANSILL